MTWNNQNNSFKVRATAFIQIAFYDENGELPSDYEATLERFEVAVQQATWVRNTDRKADKAEIEIPFDDFPISPAGIVGGTIQLVVGEASDGLQVFAGDAETAGAVPSDTRFLGQIDSFEISIDDGKQVVKVKARDYTSFFEDTKPKLELQGFKIVKTSPDSAQAERRKTRQAPKPLYLDKTLSALIQHIVKEAGPHVAKIFPQSHVVFLGTTGEDLLNETVGSILKRRIWSTSASDNWWQILCAILDELGLIPQVYLDFLYIKRASDPLWDEPYDLMLGRDIISMDLKRDFRASKQKDIILSCFNPRTGELLTTRYPERQITDIVKNADTATKFTPSLALSTLKPNGLPTAIKKKAPAEKKDKTHTDQDGNKFELGKEYGIPKVPTEVKDKAIHQVLPPRDITEKQLFELCKTAYYESLRDSVSGHVTFAHKIDNISGLDMLNMSNGDRIELNMEHPILRTISNQYAGADLNNPAIKKQAAQAILDHARSIPSLAIAEVIVESWAYRKRRKAGVKGPKDIFYVNEVTHKLSNNGYKGTATISYGLAETTGKV